MNALSIIGSGNVATHLGNALFQAGIDITNVVSRNPKHASELAKKLNASVCSLDELPGHQMVLICVSDDAIVEVLEQLPSNTPVAYSSGAVEISDLPHREQLGVFYPLQTLSKGKSADISEVPILIEANNASFCRELASLGQKISNSVHEIDSQQRAHLHVAAVWINNFTNHMVYQAQQITDQHQLDYSLLLPLLKETVKKLETQTPLDAQTGPARRGDQQTIEKHKKALEGDARQLYELITKSIQQTYRNEEL